MSANNDAKVSELLSSVRKSLDSFEQFPERSFAYGTAGFRSDAQFLPHIAFRMAIFSCLRSMSQKGTIGIMITASHNQQSDNGLKIVDYHGSMLDMTWEKLATEFANCPPQRFSALIKSTMSQYPGDVTYTPSIFVAGDTRPSTESLKRTIISSAQGFGANIFDFGLLTTGQIHWIVRQANLSLPYQECDYVDSMADAFKSLVHGTAQTDSRPLLVDGANGVGAIKLKDMSSRLKSILPLEIVNDGEGELNHLCGADYVQRLRNFPTNIAPNQNTKRRMCSVDGDCDRVVFFTTSEKDHSMVLYDGDKIAALYTRFLHSCLDILGIADQIKIGVVKTAYANGASVSYICSLPGVEVAITPTGVKHLHHKAEQYDVGVYFEANGHGTVLFGPKFYDYLHKLRSSIPMKESRKLKSLQQLTSFCNLMNQATGDGISDLLAVEGILRCCEDMTMDTWELLYRDLPSRLASVEVPNKNIIVTTADETRILEPEGVQEEIDQVVARFSAARCFVRPSGTEDTVRIYAEAETAESVDSIVEDVIRIIKATC